MPSSPIVFVVIGIGLRRVALAGMQAAVHVSRHLSSKRLREDVLEIPVVAFRPDVVPGLAVGQLMSLGFFFVPTKRMDLKPIWEFRCVWQKAKAIILPRRELISWMIAADK